MNSTRQNVHECSVSLFFPVTYVANVVEVCVCSFLGSSSFLC